MTGNINEPSIIYIVCTGRLHLQTMYEDNLYYFLCTEYKNCFDGGKKVQNKY